MMNRMITKMMIMGPNAVHNIHGVELNKFCETKLKDINLNLNLVDLFWNLLTSHSSSFTSLSSIVAFKALVKGSVAFTPSLE